MFANFFILSLHMDADIITNNNKVRAASDLTETEWNYEYICDIIPASHTVL